MKKDINREAKRPTGRSVCRLTRPLELCVEDDKGQSKGTGSGGGV